MGGRSNNTHPVIQKMKENICTIIGMVGEFFAALLGGRDSTLTTLVIFMTIDFATGLIVAAMGKSKHSRAGWVGLAKKVCTLLMIIVAVRIDLLVGTTYVRDATCIGFSVNELLLIIENTSGMGLPYPDSIKKAIKVLQKKAGRLDNEIQEMIDEFEEDDKR